MEQIISNRAAAYAAKAYKETLPLLGSRAQEADRFVDGLAGDERILMEFLYGTMPVCDAADCEPGLIYRFVQHALWLRRHVAWTKELPEDLFFHYVLCYRVNNEAITDCRAWFYEMLMPVVAGCGQEEAVKRVNYWCAGQAAYTASDERTLGPVGVYYSGSGRCGEESTFLVTALRSIGIAARQVYTPRWAHCDDNHAWVEAYVDGQWRFLGACEPEEALDKGWFTNASSRAMMVHTRVFSDYQSGEPGEGEELTERDGAALFLNDTPFYARTEKITVVVVDADGKPVCGARVAFELLNGAEFYPVSALHTGEKGEVSLTMGLGSIHLHVSKGELCAEAVCENGAKLPGEGRSGDEAQTRVTVTLSGARREQESARQKEGWQEMDLIAPRDYPVHPVRLTREQKERCRAGRQEAERLRQQKLEGYGDPKRYEAYPAAAAMAGDDPKLREILGLALGNAPEICRFLERHPEPDAVRFLAALTKKDYRDLRADVLEEHYICKEKLYDDCCRAFLGGVEEAEREELFLRYVWNPRIRYEALTTYRAGIDASFTAEQKACFRSDPGAVWSWILKTVGCEPERNYRPVVTSPAGVLRTGQGSLLSKKTLFVAVCRTLGIPARIDPVTQEAQYYGEHGFVPVTGSRKAEDEALPRLILTSEDAPVYFVSWTIGRETAAVSGDGIAYTGYETLDFTGRGFEDGRLVLTLQEGRYRLITTVRLPNGNQMAATRIVDTADFHAGEDGVPECTLALYLRRPEIPQMLESLQLEEFTLRGEDGAEKSSLEILDRHAMLAFLEEGAEPTEHLLNELCGQRQEVLESGLKLVFVLARREALSNPTLADALTCLPAEVYYDDFAELPELLARRMYTDPEKLPLVLLTSPGVKRGAGSGAPGGGEAASGLWGRYASSGYNVGSVRMMLQIAKLLEA